jgi:hypothetical protein
LYVRDTASKYQSVMVKEVTDMPQDTRRFQNFSFYPSIPSTGLVRVYDSLKTEKQFIEKRRKRKDRKKKEENWRKKFREISRLPKIEEI